MPSLRAFTQETATTMHALDMDLILAPLPNSNLKQQTKPLPTLPRSKLRSGSPSLQVGTQQPQLVPPRGPGSSSEPQQPPPADLPPRP